MSKNNMPEDESLNGIIQALIDRVERLERAVASTTVRSVPAGGTTGQSLKKTSNADFAMTWQT